MKYNRKIAEKALECCGNKNDCKNCPIREECESNPFESAIAKYSAKYVEDLKEEIASLKTIPEQLHREMSEQMLEERRIERKYTAKKMRALVYRELERMCLAEDAYIPFPLTWLDKITESIIDEKNT
jgi:hypothetical protein